MTYPNSPQCDLVNPRADRLADSLKAMVVEYGFFEVLDALRTIARELWPGCWMEAQIAGGAPVADVSPVYGFSDGFTDVADYNHIPDPDDAF